MGGNMNQSDQPIELPPCPFCGGKAKPVRVIGRYVECVKCRYEILEKFWIMRAPIASAVSPAKCDSCGLPTENGECTIYKTHNPQPSEISVVDEEKLVEIVTQASYWHDNPYGNGNGAELHKYRARHIIETLRPYLRTSKPVMSDTTEAERPTEGGTRQKLGSLTDQPDELGRDKIIELIAMGIADKRRIANGMTKAILQKIRDDKNLWAALLDEAATAYDICMAAFLKRESGNSASEVCHQLREAIMHLTHEKVFTKDSSVIQEMEAAINEYNGWNK